MNEQISEELNFELLKNEIENLKYKSLVDIKETNKIVQRFNYSNTEKLELLNKLKNRFNNSFEKINLLTEEIYKNINKK